MAAPNGFTGSRLADARRPQPGGTYPTIVCMSAGFACRSSGFTAAGGDLRGRIGSVALRGAGQRRLRRACL